MTRCALYLRVSSIGQKNLRTIEGQDLELRKYAESQSWDIIETYRDEAKSGASLRGRDDFLRLLEDIERPDRGWDVLLVAEYSRITRTDDPLERGKILKALIDNSIKLASPGEGIQEPGTFHGELVTTLKFLFAGQEKKDIQERMSRGRARRLAEGQFYHNNVPFGLRKVVVRNSAGKVVEHKVEIDKDQANVLRTVFDWIVQEGKSLYKCVNELNEMGIKTPRGKEQAGQKYRLLEKRAIDHKEVVKIEAPAIFTEEEMNILREHLNERRTLKGSKPRLLSKKLVCGVCGAPYIVYGTSGKGRKRQRYYACWNRINRKGPEKCLAPIVPADELDAKIEKSLFTDLFRRPKTTVRNWFRQDKVKKRRAEKIQAEINKMTAEIKKLKAKGSQLLADYRNRKLGAFSVDDVNSEKMAINAEMRIREERIRSLTTDLKSLGLIDIGPKEQQAIAEEIKRVVKDLKIKYKAMTEQDKRRLIEYYIPPTSCIEIEHATNDDGERIGGYSFIHIGLIDRVALLTALSDYAKSGKVPAYTGQAVSHNRINAESNERRYMHINWLPSRRARFGPSWIRSLR
jgi:DNA invertase Pin-like site-specific DNA recombinase